MHVGITFDLRDHYRSLGFTEEEVAEFDSIETIDAIDNTLLLLGFKTERIGTVKQLAGLLTNGKRWDFIFNIASLETRPFHLLTSTPFLKSTSVGRLYILY